MTTFGGRIRELRKRSSLTLVELGGMVGLSNSYLSEIETGNKAQPSVQSLDKIARALGVTLDYLMGTESDVTEAEDNAFCLKYRGLDPEVRARIRRVVDALVG